MLLAGVFMVLLQCVTMPRLFMGALAEQCETMDGCHIKGTFCSMGKTRKTCAYCGTHSPLDWQYDPVTFDSYNFMEDEGRFLGFNTTHVLEVCEDPKKSVSIDGPQFQGPPDGRGGHPAPLAYQCFNIVGGPEPPWKRVPYMCPQASELGQPSPGYDEFVRAWCHACVDPATGNVNELTGWLLPANNVNAMALADWIAYTLCSIVVTLTTVGELKDIVLVRMAIVGAGDSLSPRARFALTAVNETRRWVFIPSLLVTVIALVVFTGGLASNVCFSTVAILFVTELDNLAFFVGVDERLRARIEIAGRVQLSDEMAEELAWTKKVFIFLMPLATLVAPVMMKSGVQSNYIKAWMVTVGLYVGTQGIAEYGVRPNPLSVLKIAGKTLLGFIGVGLSVVPSRV